MIVLVSALLSLLAVGSFVQLAKRYGWGKAVRQDGPEAHHLKTGTPTMGGAAFLGVALLVWLVLGRPGIDSLVLVLLTLAAALLGLYDDLVALRRRRGAVTVNPTSEAGPSEGADTPATRVSVFTPSANPTPAVFVNPVSGPAEGAPPRVSVQPVGAPPNTPITTPVTTPTHVAAAVQVTPSPTARSAHTRQPSARQRRARPAGGRSTDPTTGVLARHRLLVQGLTALAFSLYAVRSGQELFGVPLFDLLGFAFIVVGSINAFNFTDGLDGLAGGVTALALLPFVGVGFVGALVGALLGFLWFNAHPARVFMGGVGSEALGAAVAGTAILAGWVWWLPLIALIPVLEVLSVIVQVAYFSYTKVKSGEGKRLLKMSPLHHHFELSGWSEQQVVVRMWLVTAVCVALAWGLQGGFA